MTIRNLENIRNEAYTKDFWQILKRILKKEKTMKAIKLLVVLVTFLFFAETAMAANYYVRAGATGANNGTDWTNAWNEMDQINWTSISAGDTIWLAGGTYGSGITVNKSGTSGSRIYIKRVRTTDSVPASAAGWSASFDSQVIINSWLGIAWPDVSGTTGSWVTVDGRIDSGIRTKHDGTSWSQAGVWIQNSAEGVELKYIDMAGPAGSDWYTYAADATALQLRGGYGTPKDITVSHCRMHGVVTGIRVVTLNGGVFEYNKIYDTLPVNSATYHNNSAAVRVCFGTLIWRYNEIWNGGAEGFMLGATATDVACRNEFYGNLMHSPPAGGASWRFIEVQYKDWPVIAYNNTIIDLPMGIRAVNGGTFAVGSEVRNNLFINSIAFAEGTGSLTRSFNAFSGTNSYGDPNAQTGLTTSIFVNYANNDYRLAYSTTAGYSLSSPYNVDLYGNIRGANGTWTRGAIDISSTKSGRPSAPSNLVIN